MSTRVFRYLLILLKLKKSLWTTLTTHQVSCSPVATAAQTAIGAGLWLELRPALKDGIHVCYRESVKISMAMGDIVTKEEHNTVVSKLGMFPNCLLNICVNTHRHVIPSEVIREASLWTKWSE